MIWIRFCIKLIILPNLGDVYPTFLKWNPQYASYWLKKEENFPFKYQFQESIFSNSTEKTER